MIGILRTIGRQKNLAIGGGITLMIVLVAIFAPLLAPYDPIGQADLLRAEEPPTGHFSLGPTRRGATSSSE